VGCAVLHVFIAGANTNKTLLKLTFFAVEGYLVWVSCDQVQKMSIERCIAAGLTQEYCDLYREDGGNSTTLPDCATGGKSCIPAMTFHAFTQHLLVVSLLFYNVVILPR